MKEAVSYFTAVYRDDRVYIAGKSFPAGYFAVHLLNQFYINDTAARIIVFRRYNEQVYNALQVGYVIESDFIHAGEEIGHIPDALPRLEPFTFLNTESERKRVADLFSDKNAEMISDCFLSKARLTAENPDELAISHRYDLTSNPANHPGMPLILVVLSTLRFYTTLGDDIMKAQDHLLKFLKKLDYVERFDESHLIYLAEEIFGGQDFNVRTEYVPLCKATKSKKSVVARRLHFESYYSFILTDFYEGLHYGHYPRRCSICKKYFLMENARRQKYCDGDAPLEKTGGEKMSCRKYAIWLGVQCREEAADHPVKDIYRKRCSNIRTQIARGTITKEFGEIAKKIALEHKEEALRHEDYARSDYKEDMTQAKLFAEVKKRLR